MCALDPCCVCVCVYLIVEPACFVRSTDSSKRKVFCVSAFAVPQGTENY